MMHLAVLAASGAVGRLLTQQALERGHTVTAIARSPQNVLLAPSARLTLLQGDVRDPDSIARGIADADAVLSGLGVSKGDHDTLLRGATALIRGRAVRIMWLGAYGTGPSAHQAGYVTRGILALALRGEIADKVAADTAILTAGGTVMHASRLTNGPISQKYRVVPLADVPRRLWLGGISRATVAAAMIDEAENGSPPSSVIVPLSS